MIMRILRADGYVVLEATSGEHALQLCAEHSGQIHLLLTDVIMLDMNGPQLAGGVAALRPETGSELQRCNR